MLLLQHTVPHTPQFISIVCWATLSTIISGPGNNVPNADPALPNEILPHPTITVPLALGAAASALTIEVYERRFAGNVLVTNNLRQLKAQLIASIKPADLVTLHDPFFGLLNISALTIMAHLTAVILLILEVNYRSASKSMMEKSFE